MVDEIAKPPLSEEAKAARAAALKKARETKAAKRAAAAAPPQEFKGPAPQYVPTKPKPAAKDIDPDNVTLSAERLEEIKLEARKIVAKERMEALEEIALAAALEEIRGKEGQITGNPEEDALVDITIDTGLGTDRLVVNGQAFFHGHTYSRPKHVARSLMEQMYRLAMHEHSITDKPLSAFYAKPRHTIVSKRGVQNAPRRPDEGQPTLVAR